MVKQPRSEAGTSRPLRSGGGTPGVREPRKTIHQGDLSYGAYWRKAEARLSALPAGREREALSALLSTVEAGWEQLRPLQLMYEARPPEEKTGLLGHFLAFVDSDVVDLFRSVAQDCALLVPGPDGLLVEPDVDSTDGEADRFNRYLAVLRLGASDPLVPGEIRDTVQAVGQGLAGWYAVFAPQLHAAGDLLQDGGRT